MTIKVLGAAALAALTLAAPAVAADDSVWEASVDTTGAPRLFAGPSVYGVPAFDHFDVYRCAAGTACVIVPTALSGDVYPSHGGQWRSVDVSGAAAGDVFEVRFSDAGGQVVKTARTTAWQGVATLTKTPAVQGQAIVGASVTATPGEWAGGWSAPWNRWVGWDLIACRTPAGTGCAWLASDKPLVLESRWEGWYLFSVSYFSSGRSNWVAAQVPPFYGEPAADVVRNAYLAASPPVGPVAPVPPPVAKITPAPTASIRARALRRNGRLSLARVTCQQRCTVKLTVSGGGRKAYRHTLSATGLTALTAPYRRGRLTVRVEVDGKVLATGKVRA